MECAHRELCAGFADGLRGDDADSLAEFNQRTGRKIASIAMLADAVLAFASQHRANAHPVNAGGFNRFRFRFVNFFIRTNQMFLRVRRIQNVVACKTSDQAVAEFHDFVFAFINCADPNAVRRATIFFLDDHVLRHSTSLRVM